VNEALDQLNAALRTEVLLVDRDGIEVRANPLGKGTLLKPSCAEVPT
jgi:hypothetical protein